MNNDRGFDRQAIQFLEETDKKRAKTLEKKGKAVDPKTFNHLPVFKTPPFNGRTDVPIIEIARITQTHTPQASIPYKMQRTVGVVGILSRGRKTKNSAVLYANEYMLRDDGDLMAVHGSHGHVCLEWINSYDVLVPNNKLSDLPSVLIS